MDNINATCSCAQKPTSPYGSCNSIDCSTEVPSCENCQCQGQDQNCNYCVDTGSIFLPDLASMVSNFELKDVWTEITLNGSIAVPVQKLSIEQIDLVNTNVQILSAKVIETPALYTTDEQGNTVITEVPNREGKITTGRKLVIEGLICTAISYVALTCDQSVNTFHGQIPFSAFIVLPKTAVVGDRYQVYSLIEKISIKRVCDRSIDLTFALILTAEKTEASTCAENYLQNSGINCDNYQTSCGATQCFTDQPVIKGVCSPVQIENLITEDTQNLWSEISVPELLTIPSCKPNVVQILSVTSSVMVMCQEIVNTPRMARNYEDLKLSGLKLVVHAILRQRITYISDTECNSVHSVHFDVPISAYIVLRGDTSPLSKYRIRTCTEDLYACAINCRQIFKNTTLFVKAEPIVC